MAKKECIVCKDGQKGKICVDICKIDGKKILILIDKDFQDMEVMYPKYRLTEEGFTVHTAGTGEKNYRGKYGYPVVADKNIVQVNPKEYDAIIIPGGWAPDHLRQNEKVLEVVKEMATTQKVIASICHGGWVLASANIIKGKNMTCYKAIKDDMINAGAKYLDQEVVVDGNLITSRNPNDLPAFIKEIIKKLK